jgi:hypothetical protein
MIQHPFPEESTSTMSETARPARVKKPIWKRWWVIVLAAVVVIGVFSSIANGGSAKTAAPADSGVTASDVADVGTAPASNAPVAAKKAKAEPATPAEYASALVKAEMYATTMSMSKAALYDQLVSPAGEQFSKKAAKYAIAHVKADWKANALEKAKTYQKDMAMSPAAIRDQLTSSAGEQFTEKQAAYAIAHLND